VLTGLVAMDQSVRIVMETRRMLLRRFTAGAAGLRRLFQVDVVV
jgi:hypothetical protein